ICCVSSLPCKTKKGCARMAALSRPEGIRNGGDAGPCTTGKEASPMVCYALRLRPGEELKGALADFASDRGIRAGFIISCVGSVRDVVLRLAGAERPNPASPPAAAAAPVQANAQPGPSCFPAGEEERGMACSQQEITGEHQQQPMLCTCPGDRFEVLSLVGTVSPDGLHLHASLGDEEGAVSGGHLVQAIVHTTAEVVVGEASALAFSRVMDPDTGFKELVVAG
ncbi:unnamed protein product, partial [Laminaria digitata]